MYSWINNILQRYNLFIVFRCVVLINISDLETKTGNNNIVHVDEDGNEVMEHVTGICSQKLFVGCKFSSLDII